MKKSVEEFVLDYLARVPRGIISYEESGALIETLIKGRGLTKRQAIGHLVALGLYNRPQRLDKLGRVPRAKTSLVREIENLLELPPHSLHTLAKVNKPVIYKILAYIDSFE